MHPLGRSSLRLLVMWVPGMGVRAERIARLLRDDDGEDSAEPAPLALDHGAHTGLLEDIQAPSPPILPQFPTPHLLAPPQSTPAHRATPSS